MTAPRPQRTTVALVCLLALAALLAACDGTALGIPRDITVAGVVLDDDGTAFANATVTFEGAGAGTTATLVRAQSAAEGCDAPVTSVLAWTCTDASGAFELTFGTTEDRLLFTARSGFRLLRFSFDVPSGVVPGLPERIDLGERRLPDLDPVEDLRTAIAIALPGLRDYTLLQFPDDKVVFALETLMADGSETPIVVRLPVRDADGRVDQSFAFTAYHHDLRLATAATCDGVAQDGGLACSAVAGASATFQGVPAWDDARLADVLRFPEEYEPLIVDGDRLREEAFQPSVVSLIGEGPGASMTSLAAFYFGQDLAAPSGLQSLRSVLETVHGPKLTERLVAAAGADTYLVYSLADYDVPDEHVDHANGHPEGLAAARSAHAAHGGDAAASGGVTPLGHVGIDGPGFATLVAQMVADTTIYDRTRDDPRVQPGWVSRADHAANLQDLAFTWLQIYADAPAGTTTLERNSNAFVVRTRIGRYWALTEASARAFTFPANTCGTSPALIESYRDRSPSTVRDDDLEYWAWWTNTNRYATFDANGNLISTGDLGCAFVGAMGLTGRDGNVSWTHLSFQTLDNTSATFAHETGHLLNGSHRTTATTRASQRCNLLGFIPIGPTGPSLHARRVVGTTRTLCFARTETGDTTARNMTRIAEYLHDLLPAP
jgi:predicted small secreted protein